MKSIALYFINKLSFYLTNVNTIIIQLNYTVIQYYTVKFQKIK